MPITVIKRSGSFLNEPDRERDILDWMSRPLPRSTRLPHLSYDHRYTAASVVEDEIMYRVSDELHPYLLTYLEHSPSNILLHLLQ